MGLKAAVELVLSQIEADYQLHSKSDLIQRILPVYISSLKVALASNDEPQLYTQPRVRGMNRSKEDPSEDVLIKVLTQAEERGVNGIALIEGGPLDGDSVPIDQSMPPGAKVPISGIVHVYSHDRKLVYSKEETEKYIKARRG